MTRHDMLVLSLQILLNMVVVAGRLAEPGDTRAALRAIESRLDELLTVESPPEPV